MTSEGLCFSWDTFQQKLCPSRLCERACTFSYQYRYDFIILGAILALGLCMRLIGITKGSSWYDEVLTLYFLDADSFVAFVREVRAVESTGSLGYLVIAWFATQYLPGDPVLVLRGISIALGLIPLAGAYYIGRQISGRYAAVISPLLLAVSLTHVFYSQGIRPYALLMAAATLASIAFLNTYANSQISKGWLGANTLLNTIVVWTHMLGPLLLVSQGLTLWICKGRQVKQWLAWGACQLPGIAALAYFWIRTIRWNHVWEVTPDIPPQGLAEVFGYFHVLLGSRHESQTVNLADLMHTQVSLEVVILAGAIVGILGSIWLLIHCYPKRNSNNGNSPRDTRFTVIYLFVWLLAPAVILFVLDHVWTTMFFARYVFHTSVPLAVLIALGLNQFSTAWLRNGIAGILICALAYQYLAFEGPLRNDYKATFDTIREADGVDDPIIGYPFYLRRTVLYNWRRLYPASKDSLPVFLWPENRIELLKYAREETLSQGRSWLILHPHALSPAELEADFHSLGLDFKRFRIPGGMLPVFVYKIRNEDNTAQEISASAAGL
ncbi:MAG: hypothetical protein ACLFV4_08180 [Candidatus Hydrogenedentota bacterium]